MRMVYFHERAGLIAVALALAGLVACSPAAAPVPPTNLPPPTAAPTAEPTIASTAGPDAKSITLQLVKNGTLGMLLADGDGRTLYLLTKDGKNSSNCYDKCAQSWPPLLTSGQPALKDGVTSALIGTTQRKEGTTQLTYNGWPLYYFAKDQKAGDTNGQSVGKVWWVVSAEGNPIKPAALKVGQSDKLGKLLTDDAGRTVYIFLKDTTPNTTTCYDKCEQNWPPVLTLGQPTLGDGVDASLLGTTTRKDGTTQVTYHSMPLYYFAKDEKPGDTNGQGIGNVWYGIAPDGNPVK